MFSIKTCNLSQMALVCAIVMCVGAGCAHSRRALQAQRPGAKQPYTVYPPDELRIDIRPEAELSTMVTVRPDGKISMAILGDVEVEGLTPAQIDENLTKALSQFVRNVDVTVTVIGFNSKRYCVIGEVFRQGDFPLTGRITAWEAVAKSGGYTRRAAARRARVVRGDPESPEIIPVNLAKVMLKGETARDVVLRENDVVYVPPDAFARTGYFLEKILFPFTSILGIGRDVGYAFAYTNL